MNLVIPMPGFSKARPRVVRTKAGSIAYMPKQYKERCALFQLLVRHAIKRSDPFTGPIQVDVTFRFRLKGRGDLDNLAGGVYDAGNGLLWCDDRQIQGGTTLIERNTGKDEIEITIRETT